MTEPHADYAPVVKRGAQRGASRLYVDVGFTREALLKGRETVGYGDEPIRGSYAAVPKKVDWFALAACRGKTDTFYPGPGETAKSQEAKRICRSCPVRKSCEDYAQTWPTKITELGVWAGLSATERRRARREAAA